SVCIGIERSRLGSLRRKNRTGLTLSSKRSGCDLSVCVSMGSPRPQRPALRSYGALPARQGLAQLQLDPCRFRGRLHHDHQRECNQEGSMTHPIPDAALDSDIAILGRKGGGKTFTSKGIVERLLDMKRRVLVLDPLGVW